MICSALEFFKGRMKAGNVEFAVSAGGRNKTNFWLLFI
jgi:hypothetical protein